MRRWRGCGQVLRDGQVFGDVDVFERPLTELSKGAVDESAIPQFLCGVGRRTPRGFPLQPARSDGADFAVQPRERGGFHAPTRRHEAMPRSLSFR